MAELVLSAFLGALFEKLASATLKSIARRNGIDADINKLRRSLTQIQDVLVDASRKEVTSQPVKTWLNDLQHLAYDIDDVLDELSIDATHRDFTNDASEAITGKVRNLIPSCCTNFSRGTTMHDKLDSINAKLHDLVRENRFLKLNVEVQTRHKSINRRLQTSMVDSSRIIGRHSEKEALVNQLLSDEPCDQNFNVVPIVGMGGVGKTTLARLLYHDKHVNEHFKLKAWVCVSDDFDSFGISKVIFQSVAGVNKGFADLNLLQEDLVKHLSGKRFLLVLDDVWSESYEDWKILVGPFHQCAHGSLVKKCSGLPLGLIALGTSLRTKEDEDSWREVLESEIWRSNDDEILPALRLSYHDLSARLKRLFAYCSLFPKDCLFDKEELVLLWMAEGFLHQSPNIDLTEECLGHKYFDELLSRSFFQQAPASNSLFVMHDMMNDLATFVAGEFFLRLDIEAKIDTRMEMVEKYRHMSFVRDKHVVYKTFESFTSAKRLRTFLATSAGVVWHSSRYWYYTLTNKVLVDLLPELPLLRVLSLSSFSISEVPESIGTLRHLRYLNLSRTAITCLPETVCNLYNLQALIVFSCRHLAKLPNNFIKLKKLRHLDIRDTPHLNQMPLGIDELKSLQTLSKIIVGGERGIEIIKLKDFKNLCGKISIMGLEKVQKAIDAREANFSKKRISELEVTWSDVFDGSRNEDLEDEVLNELKPRNGYLEQLKIGSYGGLDFPIWVGDPSFLLLKHVSLSGCEKCVSLPPLGQLPSLKELFIEGLDGVKVVGLELLGSGCAFRSLEILSFKRMKGWEEWSMYSDDVFPCLQQLCIEDCPNLSQVLLATLHLLNDLTLVKCDSRVLRRLVQVAPAITKLDISELNVVTLRGVIEYLSVVEELIIMNCKEIRYLWESEVEASKVLLKLRKLAVRGCDNMASFGEKEEDGRRSNLTPSLREFTVHGGSISSCDKLFEKWFGGQNMLEHASISGWSNLKSITELNYLLHLTTLMIWNCKSLESFPDKELPNMTSIKIMDIVNCPSMDDSFPCGFWPPNLRSLGLGKLKKPITEWGPHKFPPSLVILRLYGGEDGVSSSTQISHLLPSSLTTLWLFQFETLQSFSVMGLTHLQRLGFSKCPEMNKLSHPHPQGLTSLKHLHFRNCPNMMDLPQVLLPSLLSLEVYEDCPNLKERCSRRGDYWPFIAHIPRLDIRS